MITCFLNPDILVDTSISTETGRTRRYCNLSAGPSRWRLVLWNAIGITLAMTMNECRYSTMHSDHQCAS
jgi:hypothetical protein